jgi:hypothetical protein
MNDPKLERCKQIIQQYEDNQKKIAVKPSPKPKVRPVRERPPKVYIPKKENRLDPMKDVVSDIKKIDYNSLQDIKDKVKDDIELDKEVDLDQFLTDEEEDEYIYRSSISNNIKKKINKETPKKKINNILI